VLVICRYVVPRQKFSLAASAQEREMPKLIGVSRDNNTARSLKDGQATGNVTLCRFIDDCKIEELSPQGQDLVYVGEFDQPDGQSFQQNPEIDLPKEVFLPAAGPGPNSA
jgi:hypothetical protein